MQSTGTEKKTYLPHLTGDEVLARDLFGHTGKLILPKGTLLTHSKIVLMKQFAVSEVWVLDRLSALNKLSPATAQAYQNTVACMRSLFHMARRGPAIDLSAAYRALHDLSLACKSETNFLHLITHLRTFDDYSFQHSVRVGVLSRRIAEWMGLSELECQELFIAAALFDIGKCRIDEQILNKPGRLTQEEYEHVKQHAVYGYNILSHSGLPEHLAAVALNHHERMNGTGYPRRLQGEEIDLYSRIVAVADVFNAMTSQRVYHTQMTYYRVLDELLQNAFGELDPAIVSVFVNKMTTFLIGNEVILSDGTTGTVVLVPTNR
ncbi:MAG: HD-GYP domain-containing protein, partial [Tumebacillaceae bacterium]